MLRRVTRYHKHNITFVVRHQTLKIIIIPKNIITTDYLRYNILNNILKKKPDSIVEWLQCLQVLFF